jgi:hypothetical protein
MADSERVNAAAYRLRAARCAEMAQRAADHEGRGTLQLFGPAGALVLQSPKSAAVRSFRC